MYRKLKTEQNAPNKALCIQKTKDWAKRTRHKTGG